VVASREGGFVVNRLRLPRPVALHALAALGALALCVARGAAEEPIRLSSHVPGDSKPVVIDADEIVTWVEGSQRILLVRGMVLVEHGGLLARMQEGILRFDQDRQKRTGIGYLDVYGEGSVQVETGLKVQKGTKAILDFSTRGELRIRAHKTPVVQQPRPADPLYQRFLAERREPAPPSGPIQRTSAQQPVPNAVPGTGAYPMQGSPPGSGVPPVNPNPLLPPPPGIPGPPATMPGTPPPTPPAAGAPRAGVPGPAAPPSAPGPPRQISISQRSAARFQTQTFPLPNAQEPVEHALVITGGVIITVRNANSIDLLDIEADRVVVWTRENPQQLFNNLRGPRGQTSRQLEFYLAGNVEIRQKNGPESRTLRAEEAYYDVGHNVALALHADLEFKQAKLPDPIHMRAEEIRKLSENRFEGYKVSLFSSKLPSDPGLTVDVADATLEDKQKPKTSIFGRQVINRRTGQPEMVPERLFYGDNVILRVEEVPVFWLPFLQGDAHDPLGPLENIMLGYNRIYGGQFGVTLNMYDLLGIDPIPGTRWRADVDYLTNRGPAFGTEYDYAGKDLLGIPNRYNGLVKVYGILDDGKDILGGIRQNEPHPEARGRFLWRQNIIELPAGFTLQTQVAPISDQNFHEQYFKNEFDTDINQDTFIYVKQQQNNWAWTLLAEPRLNPWMTVPEALPRADGYLLGQSFFDLFTYSARASVGYFQLRPSNQPPEPPVDLTLQRVDTGRFDLTQELSLPFHLGPVKLVPYLVGDLTYYTEDLTDNNRGRLYGAGGVRGSMPLTRIYPDIHSELLNLDGINHKIVIAGNYYNAVSDTPFNHLPQLDMLDDEATDQARRDIHSQLPFINPAHGLFLATSPLFDPQVYAIRRLVDSRIDTEDSIEVFQADIRQRWQTKRGYPGMEHIMDWMTLDLAASIFPHSKRDNFGDTFGILQYDWVWNVGDRTALVSNGWMDPITDGGRFFTVGAFFNRPDKTSFYVGYRQIDPVQSQAVTGAVTYVFSPKYAVTGSTTYDFGFGKSLSNSLVFTRMGTDLQISFGVTYNAIVNTFGVTFEILPNVVPLTKRIPGMAAFGSSMLGR
jgi:hypothetical protein